MDGALTNTNQHYITKAYLDRFVHPDSKQEVLFPYRKGGNACKPRGTKRLGSAANFYRQRENGVLHDRLDEARKVSETLLFASGKRHSSPLSQCVFDDRFNPSEVDRLHLATAAAFLFCGSPVQIHNTAMHALLQCQMDLFNWHATEEARESFRVKHGDAADERLEESRAAVLKGELFLDVGKDNWKQLGFTSFQVEADVIHSLLDMKMTIVDCHYRCLFLTSDNPVVRTFPSAWDIGADDAVWFPISYKRGVLWHRRRFDTRTCLGYSESHALNRRVIKHSFKYVYAPRPDSSVESATRHESFDPLFGYYGSLERVIGQARPAINSDGTPHGEIVDLIAALRSGSQMEVVGI